MGGLPTNAPVVAALEPAPEKAQHLILGPALPRVPRIGLHGRGVVGGADRQRRACRRRHARGLGHSRPLQRSSPACHLGRGHVPGGLSGPHPPPTSSLRFSYWGVRFGGTFSGDVG